MWVAPGAAAAAACGASMSGNLCSNQSVQANQAIGVAVTAIELAVPETTFGKIVSFIDNVTTYVSAFFQGSPNGAIGTVVGTAVEKKLTGTRAFSGGDASRAGTLVGKAVDTSVDLVSGP